MAFKQRIEKRWLSALSDAPAKIVPSTAMQVALKGSQLLSGAGKLPGTFSTPTKRHKRWAAGMHPQDNKI